MLMGLVAAIAVAVALCRRGALAALAALRLRSAWTLPAALGLQVLVVTVAPGLPRAITAPVHLLSYALAGVFLALNIRLPGMSLVASGTAANAVTIALNGGVLPASAAALTAAGWRSSGNDFANSASLASPHLAFLGDNYVSPAWLPLRNVFSIGDVLIGVGLVALVFAATRRKPRHRAGRSAISALGARFVPAVGVSETRSG